MACCPFIGCRCGRCGRARFAIQHLPPTSPPLTRPSSPPSSLWCLQSVDEFLCQQLFGERNEALELRSHQLEGWFSRSRRSDHVLHRTAPLKKKATWRRCGATTKRNTGPRDHRKSTLLTLAWKFKTIHTNPNDISCRGIMW